MRFTRCDNSGFFGNRLNIQKLSHIPIILKIRRLLVFGTRGLLKKRAGIEPFISDWPSDCSASQNLFPIPARCRKKDDALSFSIFLLP